MVDTGAEVSMVTPDVARQTKLLSVECVSPPLCVADGTKDKPNQVVHAQVGYIGRMFEHNFAVVANLDEDHTPWEQLWCEGWVPCEPEGPLGVAMPT